MTSFMDQVRSAGPDWASIYQRVMAVKHKINEQRDSVLTEAELLALMEMEMER